MKETVAKKRNEGRQGSNQWCWCLLVVVPQFGEYSPDVGIQQDASCRRALHLVLCRDPWTCMSLEEPQCFSSRQGALYPLGYPRLLTEPSMSPKNMGKRLRYTENKFNSLSFFVDSLSWMRNLIGYSLSESESVPPSKFFAGGKWCSCRSRRRYYGGFQKKLAKFQKRHSSTKFLLMLLLVAGLHYKQSPWW